MLLIKIPYKTLVMIKWLECYFCINAESMKCSKVWPLLTHVETKHWTTEVLLTACSHLCPLSLLWEWVNHILVILHSDKF